MEEITMERMQELDVIQRLHVCLDQLTRSKRIVADYILENTMEAAFSTVDKTAHAIGVSTTTVVRLAITLGYSGYAEMQSALKEYVTSVAMPTWIAPAGTSSEEDPTLFGSNGSLLEQEIQNLKDTCAMLSPETVNEAVKALGGAAHIYILGERNYEGVARFMAYNLDRMFLNARYIRSDYNHMPEAVNHMAEGDALVYLCFGRYLRQIGDLVQASKRLGVTVIGITDSAVMPWTMYTDVLFTCANHSASFYHSPQGAMFVANVLLSCCAEVYRDRVEESLKKLDQTVSTLQMFVKK